MIRNNIRDVYATIKINKQSRSGPTHKKTMKQRKKETRKQTNRETTENRDTAGSVSKFDISKLIDFHNTV